jgi:DNA-binding transcriptional MocR family regulator
MERQMADRNFTKVPNNLFENGRYLSPAAKLVYVVLCNFRNNKTGKTFPSYEKIMMKSGMSRNKVAAAVNELEQFYWITRKKVFIGGNHYKLTSPIEKETQQPCIWPTQDAAKQYAKQVKDEKPRYGINPWKDEQFDAYDSEMEELNDDQISF